MHSYKLYILFALISESRKRNQFGDYEDVANMKPEDWNYRWGKSQTQFHMPKIHPYVLYDVPNYYELYFNIFTFILYALD
jgi:hypothetical protein